MSAKGNNQENIQKKTLDAFSKYYNDYYVLLCTIAFNYIEDKFIAEEAVGEVFLNLWEKFDEIEIKTSFKAYLIKAVKNWCLNYLEHQKVEERLKQKLLNEQALADLSCNDEYPLGYLYEEELSSIIARAINSLPIQCRKIFILKRDDGLTYEQIAEQLQVSVNTIKTQVKIALTKLRESLKDYALLFIALIVGKI